MRLLSVEPLCISLCKPLGDLCTHFPWASLGGESLNRFRVSLQHLRPHRPSVAIPLPRLTFHPRYSGSASCGSAILTPISPVRNDVVWYLCFWTSCVFYRNAHSKLLTSF